MPKKTRSPEAHSPLGTGTNTPFPAEPIQLNIGVPAHQVDIEFQKMLDNLAYWTEHTEMDLIEQSARLHHRAVSRDRADKHSILEKKRIDSNRANE